MERKIFTISMPRKLAEKVKREVKVGGYASVSEYFRDLVRDEVEEDRVYRDLMVSEAEFKAGKGKVLRSLKDLR